MAIRLTIFSKGLLLVSVPLLSQLAFILLISQMLHDHSESQGWFTHTKEVIAQAHVVQETLTDAQASIWGLIVLDDPAFTEAFERSARRLPNELAALQDLVHDNPEQTCRAEAALAKASRLMAWLDDRRRLADKGRPALREGGRAGKTLMDDFRQEITVFVQEEERLDAVRRLRLERSQRRLQLLLIGGGVVAVASTLLLAFAFNRGIGRRFATLNENARRLAQGRDVLPPMRGSDEIARLDHSFRRMAEELAKSENALREQKQVLQSVLDSMADGVVVADEKGKFVLFNPAAKRTLGVGPIDMPAEAWAERYGVYRPDKATLYPAEQLPLAQAIRGEIVDAVEMWVRIPAIPEGVWISVNARPLRVADGVVRGGVVVFRDVSQRKRFEEALQESEKRFRLLVEAVRDYAIIMLDPEGRVTSWNTGAERCKGYRAEEILGRHFSCFYPEETRSRGRPQTLLQQALAEGRSEDEGWRLRKDGSRFWASVVLTAIHDEAGRLRGFAKVTKDLTEHKKADEAIRKLNEALEQRVEERTASLARANRELAQQNQENELFVYSVSHDLRSPLVNLEGFSEELSLVCQHLRALLNGSELPPAMRERGLALVDGDMCESLRFIRAGVRRLSNIIDGLLRLSRAGRVQHHCQYVELSTVVTRVVESLHATITERGATVTVSGLPPVWGDTSAVEQVFANLIGNALNYLEPGRPGIIEIGRVSALANEEANSQPPLRTVYVEDNGLGIPESYRPKVFQAFQRLHPTAASGEGIGLTLVRRMVEQVGGRIWFDSTEGVGTTFFVSLPAPPTSAIPHDQRPDEAVTPTQEAAHEDGTVLDPVG
jgi:PAS domain S-box-containing protein